MKAIKLDEPWKISCVELEKPTPKPGEALIKVVAAGICGSDIGAFRGTNGLVSYPRVIGHELAGIVESIPENKKGIRPGDRVVVACMSTAAWPSITATRPICSSRSPTV